MPRNGSGPASRARTFETPCKCFRHVLSESGPALRANVSPRWIYLQYYYYLFVVMQGALASCRIPCTDSMGEIP